jgi:hypothetical protein
MADAVAGDAGSWQTRHRSIATDGLVEGRHIMRKTIAGFMVAATLCGPAVARAQDPGREVELSVLAAVSNLWYTPAKVVVATLGLAAGAVAGTLSGGDTRTAYAFWVPAAGGSYFVTADQMAGRVPMEFFGSDYADRPSTYGRTHHGCAAYDAKYTTEPEPCMSHPCGTGMQQHR